MKNIKHNLNCDYFPFLSRKFFFYIANNRDHIFDFCNSPFYKIHKCCREGYLSDDSDDIEIRMLDDNLNNNYMLFGNF